MQYFEAGSRRGWVHLFGQGKEPRPLVWLMAGEMTQEAIGQWETLLAGKCRPFALAGFEPVDWDSDYAPWPLETPGGRCFGSGADALFAYAKESFLPQAQKQFDWNGQSYVLGYSLGGLAALYFAGQHSFAGCGSCSGSLWYPGFVDWLKDHRPDCPVYLSLGGKEKNTRDALMARVEDCTKAVYDLLRPQVKTAFAHEPGGHFREVPQRLCHAIEWLLGN